jgi:hypothetical protein
VGEGDETVAQGIGIVTRRDDDFLERTEPFAEPGGGGLEHGSAGTRRASGNRGRSTARRSTTRDARQ